MGWFSHGFGGWQIYDWTIRVRGRWADIIPRKLSLLTGVCTSGWTMQKRLNRSRCRLASWLTWVQGTMYYLGEHTDATWWIRLNTQLYWLKATECVLQVRYRVNMQQRLPLYLLLTHSRVTLNPQINSLRCGLSSKFVDYLLFFYSCTAASSWRCEGQFAACRWDQRTSVADIWTAGRHDHGTCETWELWATTPVHRDGRISRLPRHRRLSNTYRSLLSIRINS